MEKAIGVTMSKSIMPCKVEWHIPGIASREQFLACEAVATMMDWHCLETNKVSDHTCQLAANHLGHEFTPWAIRKLAENCLFVRQGDLE